MEENLARIFQFTIAIAAAFSVALWFGLAVWAYRDIAARTNNPIAQVFATLLVVLGFVPGAVVYLLLRPRETLAEGEQRVIEEEYLAQELASVPLCPTCAAHIRDEFLFCAECGTALRRNCHGCGRLVDLDWKMCPYCGVPQPDWNAESQPPDTSRNGHEKDELAALMASSGWTADADVEPLAMPPPDPGELTETTAERGRSGRGS